MLLKASVDEELVQHRDACAAADEAIRDAHEAANEAFADADLEHSKHFPGGERCKWPAVVILVLTGLIYFAAVAMVVRFYVRFSNGVQAGRGRLLAGRRPRPVPQIFAVALAWLP